jgi:sarcosine oxidase subunit alpha
MTMFEFEGRAIQSQENDSVATALYREGVRTFSRSFKFHRKRGLYCLTGDCPNCLMTIDGEPAVRACCTPASDAREVHRNNAWPSAEHDVMSVLWHFRALLPVGFYYKSMIRPRWLWPRAERVIRRVAGLGTVSRTLAPAKREQMNHHPDLLVIGGGLAGLAAALAAAERGESVLLAEEGAIGERFAPGATRERVAALHLQLTRRRSVTLLQRATAVGIYQGPLVPVVGKDFLHLIHPARIVVATGAVERHIVFPGSDLPGVWLGRGASRLVGVHGMMPGRRIVVVASTREGLEHLETLRAHATRSGQSAVVAAVVPAVLASKVPAGIEVIVDGVVKRAKGRGAVRAVVIQSPLGRRTIACDALVLSLGLQPRDGLLCQAQGDPVQAAGDVLLPGCSSEVAEASGHEAAFAEQRSESSPIELPPAPSSGFVCLCEDVLTEELEHAWHEGYRSTELLKRYSTATMGACQGALCHPQLRAFVCARSPEIRQAQSTTARPPARPVRMEDVAAGIRRPLEYHTPLHDRHLEHGATMEWAGTWKRPGHYGDAAAEYWAVRSGVSIMDVSTLGKYLVSGPDATAFLERLYPCRVADIKLHRSRYALLLNEAGYIFDDGLICALGDGGYFLTFTSSGGDTAEAWMREWAETWGMRVHIINRTASRSAINVAGPRSRELLQLLTPDAIDGASIPYGGFRDITVAGAPCTAIRVGFVGELGYELHHRNRDSEHLWDALLDAGRALDIRPHGLDALRLLRLEKGHLIVGQDTDFDTTPVKAGLEWAIKMDKAAFVGQTALRRLATIPRERSLLPLTFAGERAPSEGAQLFVGDQHVGYLSSAGYSPVLGQGVALGWVRHAVGAAPHSVEARDTIGTFAGIVADGPFYDPRGERLRA